MTVLAGWKAGLKVGWLMKQVDTQTDFRAEMQRLPYQFDIEHRTQVPTNQLAYVLTQHHLHSMIPT